MAVVFSDLCSDKKKIPSVKTFNSNIYKKNKKE